MGNNCSESAITRREDINRRCYENPSGFNCSKSKINNRNTTNKKCRESIQQKQTYQSCIDIKNKKCSQILNKETLNHETLKILGDEYDELIKNHMQNYIQSIQEYDTYDEDVRKKIYDNEVASYRTLYLDKRKIDTRKIYNQLYDILKSKEKKCYSNTNNICNLENQKKYWYDTEKYYTNLYKEDDDKLQKLKENYQSNIEILKTVHTSKIKDRHHTPRRSERTRTRRRIHNDLINTFTPRYTLKKNR